MKEAKKRIFTPDEAKKGYNLAGKQQMLKRISKSYPAGQGDIFSSPKC